MIDVLKSYIWDVKSGRRIYHICQAFDIKIDPLLLPNEFIRIAYIDQLNGKSRMDAINRSKRLRKLMTKEEADSEVAIWRLSKI